MPGKSKLHRAQKQRMQHARSVLGEKNMNKENIQGKCPGKKFNSSRKCVSDVTPHDGVSGAGSGQAAAAVDEGEGELEPEPPADQDQNKPAANTANNGEIFVFNLL